MIERVDGGMHRRNSGAGGERQPEAREGRAPARAADGGDHVASPRQTLDAQLAELIADVERLCAGQDDAETLPAPDPHRLAERMALDGAAAIAAQAGLGPQGVRLVLGAHDRAAPGAEVKLR